MRGRLARFVKSGRNQQNPQESGFGYSGSAWICPSGHVDDGMKVTFRERCFANLFDGGSEVIVRIAQIGCGAIL